MLEHVEELRKFSLDRPRLRREFASSEHPRQPGLGAEIVACLMRWVPDGPVAAAAALPAALDRTTRQLAACIMFLLSLDMSYLHLRRSPVMGC